MSRHRLEQAPAGPEPPAVTGARHAGKATAYGAAGVLAFGLFFGPLALSHAGQARRSGTSATSGFVLGTLATLVGVGWLVGTFLAAQYVVSKGTELVAAFEDGQVSPADLELLDQVMPGDGLPGLEGVPELQGLLDGTTAVPAPAPAAPGAAPEEAPAEQSATAAEPAPEPTVTAAADVWADLGTEKQQVACTAVGIYGADAAMEAAGLDGTGVDPARVEEFLAGVC